MPTKSEYESQGLKSLKQETKSRRLRVRGTGPNGRVLISDMAAALEADDQKRADANRTSPPTPPPVVEPESPNPATHPDIPADTLVLPVAPEPKAKDRAPKVGDVVNYRDQFSGNRSGARVSNVHDETTVDLAIFRGGGADRKTGVTYGHERGQWSWA